MTKELKAPPSSLQKSRAATDRELVIELERLATIFPRTDMDARKWSVLFETFSEDFQGKTLEQIRHACQQWRQNPDNRFFPTPGQLLAGCPKREPGNQNFYRASEAEAAHWNAERQELDEWYAKRSSVERQPIQRQENLARLANYHAEPASARRILVQDFGALVDRDVD